MSHATSQPGAGGARARRSAAQATAEHAPPARRRPPDKARTQLRILEAAAALFAARGYDGASIAAIASRAGVSRSAIFWHFSDKETLFRETLRHLLAPFVEEMTRTLDRSDPARRLLELVSVYERFVTEQRAAIQAIVRWIIESESLRTSLREPLLALHDVFARDVRDALADAMPDAEQADALAAAILAMLHGSLLLGLFDPDPRKERVRRIGLRRVVERAMVGGPPERRSR